MTQIERHPDEGTPTTPAEQAAAEWLTKVLKSVPQELMTSLAAAFEGYARQVGSSRTNDK